MFRRIALLPFLFAVLPLAYAQSLYDMETIHTIEITFPFSNWDFRLDTAKLGDDKYIIATTCIVDGEVFDSVGVKYKGNSSYNPNNAKNPFHIELTTVIPTQDIQGNNDIKLGNGFADPSFVREALSYEILRNYMKAPRCSFAKVYVNGAYIGIYSCPEHIGKKFTVRNFYSNHGAFFKCNPVMVSGSGGGPDLRYLGANPASYYGSYDIRSDLAAHWQQLINLCDTLNNFPQSLEKVLDIDRAIWMLAFNNVLVNLDSYSGAFRQNYYLYRDDNARFNAVVWDLNQSFGSFRALVGGPGGGLDTTAMKNLPLNANSTSAQHPLIQKIWANPQYRRMYIAHAKTIVEEMFASGWYIERAQELQSIIQADVFADNNKFFSNAQFSNSLTTNLPAGPAGAFIPGIQNLMAGRVSFLSNSPAFQAVAPTIENVAVSNPSPSVFEDVWVTATIQDAANAWLGFRYATPDAFARIPMYDDGLHNDGAAGDQVYGVLLPLMSAIAEYYLYAENNNAGMFSPQRAEHEFYLIEAQTPSLLPGQVVINEFVTANQTGATDPNGQYEDWIELYNNTPNPISLKGLCLTDKIVNPTQWKFPDYAVIPPNGYIAVWCDEDNGQSGYHANFKLAKEGGFVQLAYAANQVLDQTSYPPQQPDRSVARCPNGAGTFTSNVQPSFQAFNDCLILHADETTLSQPVWKIFPNPASDVLFIASAEEIASIEVFDLLGRLVWSKYAAIGLETQVDISAFPIGLYSVRVNGRENIAFVRL